MNRMVYLLLFLGITLRILVLLQDRSLFLDEANVVRNVAEKTPIEFFQPLDYQQYAPPFFMAIEKGISNLLGNTEFHLRLPILLYSIVLLLLFWRVGSALFDRPTPYLFSLALLCFGAFFIRYSTEVKQYMSDGMIALLLLLLSLKTDQLSSNRMLLWVLVGSFAVWFSMPSVFVLATVGFYFMWSAFQQKDHPTLFKWIAIAGIWLVNFAVYYILILRNDLSKDVLTDYHSTYFFPILPTSFEALERFFKLSLSFFRTSVGYTILAYVTGIGLFLAGCFALRKRKGFLFLLGFPIVLCLLASSLGYYSIIPRLTLFFLPLLLLFISFGFEFLWKLEKRWIQIPLVLLCLITITQQKAWEYFFKPFEIEEIRPVLTQVKANIQADDIVLIHQEAVPAVAFYKEHHANKKEFQLPNVHFMHWSESEAKLLSQKYPNANRVWLVASHIVSDVNRQEVNAAAKAINKDYQVIESFEETGAKAILFEKRD